MQVLGKLIKEAGAVSAPQNSLFGKLRESQTIDIAGVENLLQKIPDNRC